MAKAREELGAAAEFDHILNNDVLDDAIGAAKVIVEEFLNS
jgi:guanylate kinase